jgi:predicted aspartyl protease
VGTLAAATLMLAGGCASGTVLLTRPESGALVAPVVINGQRAEMVLDTAASGILINPVWADRLGLTASGEQDVLHGQTGQSRIDLRRLPSLRIGPFEVHDQQAAITPGPVYEGRPIAGIAGTPLLDRHIVEFDLLKLTVHKRQGRADGWRPLSPRWRQVDAQWQRPWRILVPIEIDGVSGLGLLDTGAETTTLNPAFASALASASRDSGGHVQGVDGGQISTSQQTVVSCILAGGPVRCGQVEAAELPVFGRLGAQNDRLAIVGMDWLAGQRFVIDYPAQRLWIMVRPDG